jgi:hypothetical protein
MLGAQIGIESTRTQDGLRCAAERLGKAGEFARLMILCVATMTLALAMRPATSEAKKLDLPYVTIDHPQFISSSQATFLSSHDLLIGVTDGKTAKAYPAAILAQHGVVQDRMAAGPIAVTW